MYILYYKITLFEGGSEEKLVTGLMDVAGWEGRLCFSMMVPLCYGIVSPMVSYIENNLLKLFLNE